MSIWIITTGDTDVQLKTNKNWARGNKLYSNHNNEEPLRSCDKFRSIEEDKSTNIYPVPSRVLGLVYSEHTEHYEDLKFPLLDNFCQYFDNNNKPDKVLMILTDQSSIFTKEDYKDRDCPYWQDTCKLKPIFEWYFQQKTDLGITPQFITLKPSGNEKRGIDNWDEMLKVVRKELLELKIDKDETVYVSHQAGTPAISSAVQFVTIGLFSKVQFLISNQYYEDGEKKADAKLISSSSYWRDLQVQKAKELIKDGLPGAVLELLKEVPKIQPPDTFTRLEKIIDIFNIKPTDKTQEFEPKEAIKRIHQSLDLIEIFFDQENYLPGITLLAAAQETFLKAAIIDHLRQIPDKVANIKISDLVDWNQRGLFLKSKRSIENIQGFSRNVDTNLDLAAKLKFPAPEKRNNNDQDFDYRNFWGKYIYQQDRNNWHNTFNLGKIHRKNNFYVQNTRLLKWLQHLAHQQKWEWKLLKWSCMYRREHEDDLRNQLMHNLRGVEKEDIIRYLCDPDGTSKSTESDVVEVYINEVKKPFINALLKLGLIDKPNNDIYRNSLKDELETLAQNLT